MEWGKPLGYIAVYNRDLRTRANICSSLRREPSPFSRTMSKLARRVIRPLSLSLSLLPSKFLNLFADLRGKKERERERDDSRENILGRVDIFIGG